MSTIDVLLRQVEQLSPQLAADLRNEVGALSRLRTFGLNFERHRPESVELPGRPVRRGDKVRITEGAALPSGVPESQLWRVVKTRRDDQGRAAILEAYDAEQLYRSDLAFTYQ